MTIYVDGDQATIEIVRDVQWCIAEGTLYFGHVVSPSVGVAAARMTRTVEHG
jgi:hypothetical protein